MTSEAAGSGPSRGQIWAGRIVGGLPALALFASGAMKLTHNPEMVKNFVEKFGYQEDALGRIAVLELVCALLYAVPQTSILGALAVTAYLGGAVATHVRVGDNFIPPVVLGVLVWVGLYLRVGGIRALIPLRKPAG
jgi:hypothetical protein